ncbi:hypothetical protein [Vibrio alginolyticus]|uniref:hypothetical protein n=1 Tax=Vibrio alginolyticus TaxID=663 RepID=UPI0040679191
MKSECILELFTKDDVKARGDFCDDFGIELNSISKLCSDALSLIERSDCAGDESHRASLVKGYLMLAVESIISATQLIAIGHVSSAGNSMRISYEALCTSALFKKEVDILTARGGYRFNFYKDYCNGRRNSRGDQVVSLFIKNKEVLGLSENGARFIKVAKDFYNGYSHASDLVMHSKIKPSTLQMYIGGGYDQEQKILCEQHINFIIRYLNGISSWIKAVAYNAK